MSQAPLLPSEHFSPSFSLHSGRPATTSLEVAKFFGKRHTDVLRDVNNFSANCPETFSRRNFASAEYSDEQGKPRPMFILYRDGFMLLVMGYTGKKALAMKLAYIEAFNRMEAELARQQTALSAPGPDAALTPDQQCTLQAVVKGKVESIPADRRPRGLYPQIWSRFNNHFRLASYKQLPQSRLSEGIAYLMALELPAALPEAPVPAAAPAPYTPPVDMSSGRADALRRIESAIRTISGAQEVVRLFCHPGPKTMRMSPWERAMYDAEHQLYANAIDTLYAVRRTLEAGHTLERLRSPQPGSGLAAGRP